MTKSIYKCQGDTDNLCGIYACINAIIKSTQEILPFNQLKTKCLFEKVIKYLHQRRILYDVHQNGMNDKLLCECLNVIKSELSSKAEITVSQPFTDSIPLKSVIRKLSELSQHPYTAVILSLEGKYCHWTLLDRIIGNRIYLIDSNHLKYININKIPNVHQLIADEISVITAVKGLYK